MQFSKHILKMSLPPVVCRNARVFLASIIFVCLRIVMSNTYCIVSFFPTSYVPNVASFSWLSIFDCPFGIPYRLFIKMCSLYWLISYSNQIKIIHGLVLINIHDLPLYISFITCSILSRASFARFSWIYLGLHITKYRQVDTNNLVYSILNYIIFKFEHDNFMPQILDNKRL